MAQDEAAVDRQILADQGALGAEPSEDYKARVDGLDNIVRECLHVSRGYSGIRSPSGRHFYASVLFTALVNRSVSLLMLVPHTPWASKLIEHWDYASVAGITRTILELRLAFHYLCAESCSEDEWNCRWNVFNLHDCTSRKRMFESQDGGAEQVAAFDAQADELRDRLRDNSFFQALPAKKQKGLLHGQTAYIMPLEDIGEMVGVEKETFRWLYVLLSSHVHGLPMSFYRIGDDGRGRGLPSEVEEGYTCLFLSFAMTLLVGARDELHVLFDGLVQEPSDVADSPAAPTPTPDLPSSKFAIGESITLHEDESIRLEAKRDSETEMTVFVIDVQSNQPVLRRRESESEGTSLEWFDPYFWRVTVDGNSTTEQGLGEILQHGFAFRVDTAAKEILFKTK